GRRRVLTDAGREVARFANEVLGRASELQAWLAEHRRGEAGTLRVGMIDAASLYVLPETIRRFRAEYPAVDLRVVVDTSAALLVRLDAYDLDLAFVVGPLEARYEAVPVLREPLYIYAPRGVAERPEDGSWVLYPSNSQTRALIDAGLSRAGLRVRVALESSNPEILRQMVVLGLGWSVLPEAVAESAEPRLERYRLEAVASRMLVAVRRGRGPADPRAKAFLGLAARASAGGAGDAPDAPTDPR
ncbi:MAG: LysR substrate-binding domain-containing protein, partial [Dehalococcoidia bacterium]